MEAIAKRLPNITKVNICCEYQDLDGDKVRINCNEDFSILHEELEGQKSVKIFVKEDLNQTLSLPETITKEVVLMAIPLEPIVLEKQPEIVVEEV